MTGYPVGFVAEGMTPEGDRQRIMRSNHRGWYTAYGHWADSVVADIRPLVVLDLGAIDIPDFLDSLRGGLGGDVAENVADQIEGQTRPPKPAEPTGFGALVEDSNGHKFVRVAHPMDAVFEGRSWQRIGGQLNAVRNFQWADIDVVGILSEGWLGS